MRITHKLNPGWQPKPEIITARYQTEIDQATHRSERAYAKALRDLERAEARLRQAQRETGNMRAVKVAAELVELRRDELRRLEAMMKSVAASAEHRGVRSYRPLPPPSAGV